MTQPDTNSGTQEKELWKVGAAYLSLLELPHTSHFRLLNQDIYARLRDHLAGLTKQSVERIQNEFEAKARYD